MEKPVTFESLTGSLPPNKKKNPIRIFLNQYRRMHKITDLKYLEIKNDKKSLWFVSKGPQLHEIIN